MRYEVWDFEKGERMMAFGDQEHALIYLRGLLGGAPVGRVNALGLVDKGGPGEYLTYPLEGAALLAKAFGLKEDE